MAMTTKVWLSVALACGALAGCATEHQRIGNTPCTAGTCFVDVTVSNCSVIVDPEQLQVARGNRDAVLHWKLDTASFFAYRFADRGIAFGEAGGNQFHTPQGSAFGREFTWGDRNTTSGKFKYTVNLERRWGGGACPPLDPFVINN